MKNTIKRNRKLWDSDYHWSSDGDEWQGQAAYCGVDYEVWKASLVKHLLNPYLVKDATVLEIAPGHGRWSELMIEKVKKLILVDLGENNIEFCRNRFQNYNHIEYVVNDGKSLPGVDDESVDFIWSYDSFVHMDNEVINAYFSEMNRVLKPGGQAVIHHAGRSHTFLWLGFIRHRGEIGKQIYKLISMKRLKDDDGWRSNVSKEVIRKLARQNGLNVLNQLQYWDIRGIGVPRFNDCITELEK